ncbi:MAG: nucleotide sugar dehydrogenase, partial [Bacteroidia bacterium]|nr:nucleotide sugar dehydrogenase [Bacteroidia bacterium]
MEETPSNIKIAVLGLGYVGLPVALEFAKKYEVKGFDVNAQRVHQLSNHIDITDEIASEEFTGRKIAFTDQISNIAGCNYYIIAVPTPVDEHKTPDLEALTDATEMVAGVLSKDDTVIYESTVYPGCTEEHCIPILEKLSGLKLNTGFKVGYSPERINPGDRAHTISKVVKVVSGSDDVALQKVSSLYRSIVEAGIFEASSIKVAEAAKIIENTQRDVNIALMNELAMIFDRLGISTRDVLAAASTKWNFLNFYPGLVGGHCIDIDPYYLAHKAEIHGYIPEVILSGRRTNTQIPKFIARKIVKTLAQEGKVLSEVQVLIKGLTFKENVSDVRNSRVFDLIHELEGYGMEVHVQDPHVE